MAVFTVATHSGITPAQEFVRYDDHLAALASTSAAPGIDPADPWRGLYAPELMPKLDGVDAYHVAHPDLPSWPKGEDEERGVSPLVKAQGFELEAVFGEYPDDDDEDPDYCAWLAQWQPAPPVGEHWRLVCIQDTEDGPAAFYVRPFALIDASPKGFDMLAHLQRQRDFSGRTFGPGTRSAGIVDHIRKELREIEAAPDDLSEWIDVVILALDGAWRSGSNPQQIIDALVAKQAKNEGRVWPDWRTMPADQAIEHDRSVDSPKGGSDEASIPEPHQECYSDDGGDSWHEHPADAEIVEGLAVGDTYTLTVSHYSVERTYRVIKAPDETSDDYEVEPVQATSAEVGA